MRDIKFRGKRLDNGEWGYGSLVDTHGKLFIGTPTDPDNPVYMMEWKEVNPETVGQYTGLKDANCREIYEGDIILTPLKNVIIVRFGYREWIVQQDRTFDSFAAYGWLADSAKNGFTDFLDNTILQGEVINNIHDNPEIL